MSYRGLPASGGTYVSHFVMITLPLGMPTQRVSPGRSGRLHPTQPSATTKRTTTLMAAQAITPSVALN